MDTVTVANESSSFQLIDYLYDDGGGFISDLVSTQMYGNLDYLEFVYDNADRITEVTYLDSTDTLQKRYGYAYDSLGNLTVYTEYSSTSIVLDRQFYQYDSNSQLMKIIDKDGNEIRFDYGSGGLLALSILIDGNTIESNYNIDLSGILQSSSFSFMGDTIASISRDYETTGLMRLEGTLLVMTVNTQNTGSVAKYFGYDTNSSRVNSVTIDIGQDEDNEYIITYEYDELGNITLIEYLDGQDVIKSFEYTYDSLNRLSTEDIMTIGNSYSNLYRYDSNGNILGVLKYDFNQIPAFDLDSSVFPVNEDHLIASKTYNYSDEWLDQLESYVTMDDIEREFTYDDQGNPLTITNFEFRNYPYDHADLVWFGRQLTSISVENEYNQIQATISYSYNDQGFRTKKVITEGSTVETYEYELLGSTVYFEKYTNSTSSLLNYELSYLLDSGNEIIGFIYNGDAYYYLKDIQGNILSVVDDTGAIRVQYDYDAYGNLINNPSGTIAQINPYTYRGYRWDNEIQMYYLNSRFYSPEISRFINSDGIIVSNGDILASNMYSYCNGNPITFMDPSGYYMRTFAEYMSDGSGSESTIPTALEVYFWYCGSSLWVFESVDTYNDEIRDSLISLSITALGVILCIPSGGTSVLFGLSAVQLAGIGTGIIGIGMIVTAPFTDDTSWKSITFHNINDSSITMTFWIEYYNLDGVDVIYTVSTMRPLGLVQD